MAQNHHPHRGGKKKGKVYVFTNAHRATSVTITSPTPSPPCPPRCFNSVRYAKGGECVVYNFQASTVLGWTGNNMQRLLVISRI